MDCKQIGGARLCAPTHTNHCRPPPTYPPCHSERQPRNPNGREQPIFPPPTYPPCHSERQPRNPNRREQPIFPPPTYPPCHSERQSRNPQVGSSQSSHHQPTLPVIPSASRGIPTVGNSQSSHHQPTLPVIPSASRGIPTVGNSRSSHHQPTLPVIPSASRGIPTERGSHHGLRQTRLTRTVGIPRLALGMTCKRGMGMGRMVNPHGWDSSAGARNDMQEGYCIRQGWLTATAGIPRLALGMTCQRGMGMGRVVDRHGWDSSAVARNDRPEGYGDGKGG